MNPVVFRGRVASRNISRLQGVVFHSADDLEKLPTGVPKIFVAQDTTVDDVPLIQVADAVLTEHGGLLSHAAIVCRELRIPCIVAIKSIFQDVQTGDLLVIDFNLGEIRLERA